MLEPMVVLTYVTDQQNRMVARTQHFMNGFYMQDGSFINVIYQRDLDVARRAVQDPADERDDSSRHLQVRRGRRSPTTRTPRGGSTSASPGNPMQFYGGHAAGDLGGGRRARRQAISRASCTFSRNDVKTAVRRLRLEPRHPARRLCRVAAHDHPQPDAVQLARPTRSPTTCGSTSSTAPAATSTSSTTICSRPACRKRCSRRAIARSS